MSHFNIQRQQESELPYHIAVQFINVNTDYQQGSQQAMRTAVTTKQKTTVNAPIVFDDLTAKNIAERLIYNVWVERDRFTFTLPLKYAFLEPTDVITLFDVSTKFSYVVRIIKMTASRNGSIEVEAVADFAPVYQQNFATASASVTPQTPPTSSNTVAVLFDIPALRSGDVSVGFYLAMAGETATWSGGLLYQSVDGGANFTPYLAGTGESVIGLSTSALGDYTGDWDALDTVNTVTINLYGGRTLQSTTDTGINGGANLAVLESAEGWEVIQFKTATMIAAGTYQLSNIKRGVRLTRYAAKGHVAGNRFVLLEQSSLTRANLPTEQLNQDHLYKVLTIGESVGAGTNVTFASHGEALKYGNGVQVVASSGWGGDVSLRLRPLFDTYDYLLTPGQGARTYKVEIWDAGYTTRKAIITVTGSGEYGSANPYDFLAVYPASNQTADFGALQTTLYLKVYGVSPVVGANHGGRATASGSDSTDTIPTNPGGTGGGSTGGGGGTVGGGGTTPVSGTSTFDATNTSAGITLSSNKLTATATTDNDVAVLSTLGNNDGKYYFEFTVGPTDIGGGDTGVGIASTTANKTTIGTNGTESVVIFSSGAVYAGGSYRFGAGGNMTAGTVVRVAADLTNQRIWIAIGAQPWNGDPAADPTVASSGYDYSNNINGSLLVPVAAFNNTGDSFTANFGASAFANSVPTGYTAGWTQGTIAPPHPKQVSIVEAASAGASGEFFEPTSTTKTYLNPADKSSNASLFSGNKGLSSTGGTFAAARAISPKTTGKFYMEFKVVNVSDYWTGAGLAAMTQAMDTSYGTVNNGAAVVGQAGMTQLNASNYWNLNKTLVNGSIIRMAVDIDARKVWFAIDNGYWDGNFDHQPGQAQGSGMPFATQMPGAVAPIIFANVAGDAVLGNFGDSAFVYAVPAGFTSGWPV